MKGIYQESKPPEQQNNQIQSNYSYGYDVRNELKDYDRRMQNQGSNMYIYFLLINLSFVLSIFSIFVPLAGILIALACIGMSIISWIKLKRPTKRLVWSILNSIFTILLNILCWIPIIIVGIEVGNMH